MPQRVSPGSIPSTRIVNAFRPNRCSEATLTAAASPVPARHAAVAIASACNAGLLLPSHGAATSWEQSSNPALQPTSRLGHRRRPQRRTDAARLHSTHAARARRRPDAGDRERHAPERFSCSASTSDGLITRRAALSRRPRRRRPPSTPATTARIVSAAPWGVRRCRALWHDARPVPRTVRCSACERPQLVLQCEHVLSHDSAALVLRARCRQIRQRALVHITRRKVHGDAVRAGVKHHLAPYVDRARSSSSTASACSIPRGPRSTWRASTGWWPASPAATPPSAPARPAPTSSRLAAAMWCWPGSRVMDAAHRPGGPGRRVLARVRGDACS